MDKNKEIHSKTALLILFVVMIGAAFGVLLLDKILDNFANSINTFQFPVLFQDQQEAGDFVKFSSEDEFKEYLEESQAMSGHHGGLGMARMDISMEWNEAMAPMVEGSDAAKQTGGGEPDRVSETNVQVQGIDEPDIVKTNGKDIYYSLPYYYYYRGIIEPAMDMDEEKAIMPDYRQAGIKIIEGFPPADLKETGEIDKTGSLLLYQDTLVVFGNSTIYGYDVSNPEKPDHDWTIDISDNNYLVSARLQGGNLYLITKEWANRNRPCPIIPLSANGIDLEIKCADVYHPTVSVPVDSTFTASKVDVLTGKVEKTVSFVGSSDSAIVYMSENSLYTTYSYQSNYVEFFYGFFQEKGDGLVPSAVLDKMAKLMTYDISESAKMTEFQVIMDQWLHSVSSDEELRIENEMENRMADYYKEHKRDLEKTGIVRIDLKSFKVKANGVVPGHPLNQFSLDEYDNHLRIAVTIGGRWNTFGSWGDSASDVYILNSSLKIKGAVKDMGLTEQIYSVRFLEDKGYVVTFRQIDPFYVLDLSDPDNPKKEGELKIPGYSSYLHPITKDKILGIGKEGSKVKLSLFDVSDSANPQEIAKYNLDEYWSDVLNTHHAFLLDSKHQIFFMPGSRGGYVFSYENDKLELEKAVSNIQAQRAIYINDYLYVIGQDKIIVFNELDWERVNTLNF